MTDFDINAMRREIDQLTAELAEARDDITSLKSTLRSDERQLEQWAKRHAEMRDDLIHTAEQRDAARTHLLRLVEILAANGIPGDRIVSEARGVLEGKGE